MKKTCQLCGKPSIPGLKPGIGLCQFHFNAQGLGPRWAVTCFVSEIVLDAVKYGISEDDLIHTLKKVFKEHRAIEKAKNQEEK